MSDQTIYLKNYKSTGFQLEKTDLIFDIFEGKTIVTNTMEIKKLEEKELFLNGKELKLLSLKLDGKSVHYDLENEGLLIKETPSHFKLEIITEIYPEKNTSCEGLYKSGGIFCTQNEAQGFRKITYYFDRPDMMSTFRTKIIADKKYPMLLSNGNKIDSGEIEGDRHWNLWEDPFHKPCYLFALVAGDLGVVRDTFTTKSHREVNLEIYVDKGNEDRCTHAMESLKKSMKWDEDTFGLEYDLDIYMIVAVDSFNMGAMENKGLNIFNSVYVLAKEETAVDEEFLGIEGVIGHEYFHNWTGNRVTCRDWFQLTLKEGLTVFRDQEFSADMFDRTVQRIMDVTRLKMAQFPEDAGPMSHPIKPKSYIEINNFYTATIYEKGAEVIRMISTLIGKEAFRKGMDIYFELFDGQAVRTEDFVFAMEKASGVDLTQFKRWYDYAGTPVLNIKTTHKNGEFKIGIKQEIPENGNKEIRLEPLHIPFHYALNGEVFKKELKDWETSFTHECNEVPICEWNLGFSAPVIIKDDLGKENLFNIVRAGKDPFSRWNSFQTLLNNNLKEFIQTSKLDLELLINILKVALEDKNLSHALKAYMMKLPTEVELNNELEELSPEKVNFWIESFYKNFISQEKELIQKLLEETKEEEFLLNSQAMGKRFLRGECFSFMAFDSGLARDVFGFFEKAKDMNEEYRSLQALVRSNAPQKDLALDIFYQKWQHDNLVINKWLGLKGSLKDPNIIKILDETTNNPIFSWDEPNKVRTLFGNFSMKNLSSFHHESGEGYKIICGVIEKLDKKNPQIGARLGTCFQNASKLERTRKEKVYKELKDLESKLISPNCKEIIGKMLEPLLSKK